MASGFRLARIAGIDVYADWSVMLIVLLVTVSLSSGLLPAWHPDWGTGLRLGVAATAAFLLLASVLVHELSHAVVGRARGMEIDRITLFVFGGLAQLKHEPQDWKTEMKMAIAGPITSLLIGAGFLAAASIAAPDISVQAAEDPLAAFRALGPAATLALWLGQINIILAVFNMVPGFPLDGGRVLRAGIWGATGDLRRATRYSANAGRLVAALLIGTGVAMALGIAVPLFGTGLVGGLWLVLIGWFLHNAAVMSYRQLLIRDALENVSVARVMRTNITTVPDSLSVQELVDRHLLTGDQRAFPVMRGDRFAGLVCLEDVRRVSQEQRNRTLVREIMTPAERIQSVPPDENAADAMLALGRGGVNQLPVIQQGRVRGLLSREDILKVLSLHGDPALAS